MSRTFRAPVTRLVSDTMGSFDHVYVTIGNLSQEVTIKLKPHEARAFELDRWATVTVELDAKPKKKARKSR